MINLGLCCVFLEQPIRFRAATARYILTLPKRERAAYLDGIAFDNAHALRNAVEWCAAHGVGAFRINSGFFPLYTHPKAGYRFADLRRASEIATALRSVGRFAREKNVRLSFHPDQFVVPGSTSEAVVAASLAELEYQGELAGLIQADQLTLHAGGVYGDKSAALTRLRGALNRLSAPARKLIVLENDDRLYTVRDLLPVCRAEKIPLVYDVHHHRCNPDGLSEEDATELCARTWGRRQPWTHISSPLGGWSKEPRHHADFIAPRDFPEFWLDRTMTIDVEAKAKEKAVLRLLAWLGKQS